EHTHLQISTLFPYTTLFRSIGLTKEREKLYEDIEKRVDLMMEQGLVEEVKNLMEMGYDKNTIAMQGLGYKEIISYLKGEISKERSEEHTSELQSRENLVCRL